MSRTVRAVVVGLAAVFGILVAAAVCFFALQPTSFRIARSRTMTSSPTAVRAQLEDLRAFAAWDPWPRRTGAPPTITWSDPTSGPGAWLDARVADGRTHLTLLSVTDARIEMRSETSGPHTSGESRQIFELRPIGSGTEVTWAFEGDLHGLGRALWPFVQLEQRIGPDLESGLARLEEAAARSPRSNP